MGKLNHGKLQCYYARRWGFGDWLLDRGDFSMAPRRQQYSGHTLLAATQARASPRLSHARLDP